MNKVQIKKVYESLFTTNSFIIIIIIIALMPWNVEQKSLIGQHSLFFFADDSVTTVII